MKRIFYDRLPRFSLVFVLVLFSYLPVSAQEKENSNQDRIDSLITYLITLDRSPKKADILNEIAELTVRSNYEEALNYSERSLAISEELDYQEGILNASLSIGRVYTYYYLDYFEAKQHFTRALNIIEERTVTNRDIELRVYRDYGYLMYSMGNCNKAITYNQKAISIAEELKYYNDLASLYAYIADVYKDCGDIKNSSDYYSRTHSLFVSGKLTNIEPVVYLASASYLRDCGEFDASIKTYKSAIEEFQKQNRPRFESYAYSRLAEAELHKGDYLPALEHVNAGLDIATSHQLTKEKLDNYEVQIAIYDSLGDYKKTYISLIKFTKLKDSVNTSQVREQNRKFQTNYEEMMNQNKLEQLKDQQKTHELEIENQRLNRNIIAGILAFVITITVLMILRLRYIRRQERQTKVLTLATSHTNNSIILFDSGSKVEWVNKGFERLTGLHLEEVKGLYFLDFYGGPELDPSHIEQLKLNFESGEAFNMELASFHRETGEKYWINISVTPIFEDGELRSYISVGTDITLIHNAQEQLQKVHDRTILLNEIGRQITSTLSVHEIIEKVYENVNKLMDAQNMGIGIYKEDENSLYFPEPIERGAKLESFTYSLNNKDRLAVICFKENKEFMVGSAEGVKELVGSNPAPVAGEQPESIIYMPLISKWKTMGVISVQSFNKNVYGEKEVDIVRSLATYVAIAMENASLYENMEEMVMERTKEVTAQKEQLQVNYENIKLLSEIGVEIASSLDFEDVFETLYNTVSKLMDAEIFGVRLYHEERREIEYKYEIESGKRDPVITVSMDEKDNYSVWCIENREEILLGDNLKEHGKYIKELNVPSGKMPNSLIFYPMLADGRVFGVITVQSMKKNAYTPYHVAIVKTLSSYSAAALSNAELYDTLEQKVEERTKELAQKNKDIMASINYAKRIQRGILPTEQFINQLLPESFIFYRPRDIISGDFYWVERSRGKVFFAVVDCTGHGVPGALMSIIGKNILDQAINEKEVDDPSMILTFLRAGLRVAFSADESQEGTDVEDGMDLGVCVLDTEDRTLTFSGANSNLYLIHDGAMEIIKGEKAGVSASDFDIKNFTSHEIEIISGDIVYLSSDGFPDQFGGARAKKYSQKRFQELLLRISSLPVDTQEGALESELSKWMGEFDQLDDICVMGVKF